MGIINIKTVKILAFVLFMVQIYFFTLVISEGQFFTNSLVFTLVKFYLGAIDRSVLLFSSSLLLGIMGLLSALYYNIPHSNRLKVASPVRLYSGIIFVLFGFLLFIVELGKTFRLNQIDPSDVSKSDIIPQIYYMVNRFLNGEFPYEVINDWGYSLNPTYMPLQWLPYTIAEIFQFDYRWIPSIALIISISILSAIFYKYFVNEWTWFIWLGFPIFFITALIQIEPETFSYTVENLILAYYILLGVSIILKKPFITAIAISLCLLSRYSLVLWLPLFAWVMYFENKKALVQIIAVSFAAVLLIYIIPFFLKSPDIFSLALDHHFKAAIGEWDPYWQEEGEKPFHLYKGIGMASFFYEYMDSDLPLRIQALQKTQILLIILSQIALAIIYFLKKNQINSSLFILASFQIYLSIFYHFLQIPYWYLMTIPIYISFILLFFLYFSETRIKHIK